MIVINCEQRSEAWFANRIGRFTASSFKDLMSGKDTAGYENLIAKIALEIITGEDEEEFTSDAMERGIELESEAVIEFENHTGLITKEVGFCIPDENNILHEWVGVSPDRVIDDETILEIKCPLAKTHFKYIKQNRLPNEYKWQVQGQLMVISAKKCFFMSYYPGLKPFIIEVYPDEKMHQELTQRIIESIEEVKQLIKTYNQYEV